MKKGKFPALPGVVVKSTQKGHRYLLHDKDSRGKDIYVTIPVVDTDTKKDYLEKVEKARIKLNAKKSICAFDDLVEEYILVRQLRPNSIRGLKGALKGFCLDDEKNRETYKKLLKSGQKSILTKTRRISAFYRYLIIYKHIQISDPTEGARIKYHSVRDRIMTDAEAKILFNRLQNLHPEIQMIIRLAFFTGARVSTILSMDKHTYRDGNLYYYNAKTGAPYAYPVPLKDNETVKIVEKFQKNGGKFQLTQSAILNRIYQFFVKNFPQKNGQTLTIHSLRHTLATRLIQAGVSPDIISRILDHRSVSTTLGVYARHSEEQISDALNKIF
jgi:integrase